MKRLKYKLPKYKKSLLKFENNIPNLTAHFLTRYFKKRHASFYFAMKSFKQTNHSTISKIGTYCLVTGRTRYILCKTVSRQIFFEFCREGFLTGYYDK